MFISISVYIIDEYNKVIDGKSNKKQQTGNLTILETCLILKDKFIRGIKVFIKGFFKKKIIK